MLIQPKRNIFRVCASGDTDAANKIPASVVALLGYTLASGAAGLVAYGRSDLAGPVNINIAQPAATPDVTVASFTRFTGPLDVPLGEAISLVRADLADFCEQEGTVLVGDSLFVWKAGSIAGEIDIPIENTKNLVGTGNILPAAGTTALVAGGWVVQAP